MEKHQYGSYRRVWARLKRFEPASLGLFGILAGGAFLFQYLVGEVLEGEPLKFDAGILLAFRQQDDPAIPIGPSWLLHAADDITSLGGVTVLSMLTILVTLYFVVARKRGLALYIALCIGGGWLVSTLLKIAIGRPRPDIVPHLVKVSDLSFPSGHAMLSAITYLTLGALLAKGRHRSERVYVMGCAILLTVTIGISRVYLGVHYPSDVIGGWCAGTIWALFCWLVANRLPHDSCRTNQEGV
ncbi:phosphatase PAP2 family protein (plasmid) [Agrobacterium tumefaciens]|uniref:phosphatase PAP2 family protein n=1 Tax=Rhizobiaceae TaxID=82115 RepID=UPI001ACD8649|nr:MULTISPECIES: phosphatase PAP2 family protein [Rhizobiaceae]MBN9034187.1 phosphatase PAP2 family protein [Hyphomicrobiales bacterium]MDG3580315.1 phosphatase PAP2 family protein [Rhizobium sp. YJ-22]WKL23550.1 phosphatase PAP2 family protein [Agrobacterium tumefaciens]